MFGNQNYLTPYHMKFKALILAVLFAFCASACKKDSKNDAVSMSITGKWYFTEYKVSGFKNGVETIATYYKKEDFNGANFISFDGNNTGQQYVDDPFYMNLATFSYTYSNSILTIKPMMLFTKHDKFTVNKLSENEMTLTVRFNNADGSYDLDVLRLSK